MGKTEIQIYTSLLADIKTRIREGQQKVARYANTELTEMYWDIGRMIHERQQLEGWGAAIIPKVAKTIVNELPEIKGFSERNLKRMLSFYREYSSLAQAQNLKKISGSGKVPQPVAQLPWGASSSLLAVSSSRT